MNPLKETDRSVEPEEEDEIGRGHLIYTRLKSNDNLNRVIQNLELMRAETGALLEQAKAQLKISSDLQESSNNA